MKTIFLFSNDEINAVFFVFVHPIVFSIFRNYFRNIV